MSSALEKARGQVKDVVAKLGFTWSRAEVVVAMIKVVDEALTAQREELAQRLEQAQQRFPDNAQIQAVLRSEAAAVRESV